MSGANIGSAGIEVYPDARGWSQKLKAAIERDTDRIGRDVGTRIGTAAEGPLADRIKRGIERGAASSNPRTEGAKQGEQFGGAYAQTLKAKLEAAFKSLPDAKIDANTKPAEKKLAELRTELLGLQHLDKLNLKIDNKTILANIGKIEAELKALEKGDHDIEIKVNARSAASELASLRSEIEGVAKAAVSGGSGIGGTGALVGGLGIAALALSGPLVGSAVAGLGAVAGAAGTAYLAYKGFNKEIENGTPVGRALQDELAGIKAELGDLASTAGKSAGPGVIAGLDKIRAFIPSVDGPIAGLAAHLGKAFNTGSDALVHGLRAASPLLDDAGRYAEQFAMWLDRAAQSDQFKSFIDYARKELPQVGSALASVAKGFIDIGVALHPIGDDLVKVVDLTGKLLSGASTVSKIGSVTPGGKGYNSESSKTKERGFLRLVNDNIVGSVTGQGTTSRSEEKARVQNLKDLAKAQQEVAVTQRMLAAGEVRFDPTSIIAAVAKTNDATAANVQLSQSEFSATNAATSLQAAQGAQATALSDATNQMRLQGDIAGLLKGQLDALAGKQLSAAQTQNQFDQQLVSLAKTAQTGSGAVDGLSESAINNKANLLSLVTAATSAAGAYGDVKQSGSAAQVQLAKLKDEILRNADAAHLNHDQVKALLDQLLPLDGLHVRSAVELDIESAKAHAKEIQALIDKLHGASLDVNVIAGLTGNFSQALNLVNATNKRNALTPATGGLIRGPGTGRSDSIPAMVSNGEYVVNAAATARNKGLLDAINGAANVHHFADGGIVSLNPKKAPKGPSAASQAKTNAALIQTQGNIRFNTGLDLLRFLASSVSTVASVRSAMLKLITDVHNAAEKGVGSGQILGILGAENNKLQSLANQRASIGAKMKAANANVLSLKTQFRDEAVKVAGATSSSFDITSLDTGSTAGAIRILENRVKLAGQFTADLAALRAKGLNKTLIQQLGEAGVGQAGSAAHLLAGASKGDVTKIDALFAQINKNASAAGNQVAGSLFQAGIDSAVGYANGLKSKLAQVNKAAASLAAEVVKQIKKDLGIHSPSRVGHELGEYFGIGFANGISNKQKHVAQSASDLAYAAAPSATGGGAGMSVTQNIYQQPGQDPASLAEDSSRRIARRIKR